MTKKKQQVLPGAGEAFAVPLEGGRFTVCRVLKSNSATGLIFVAGSSWFGERIPDAGDPEIRPILRLTHHNWKNKRCAAWVDGSPPADYRSIGTILPDAADLAIRSPDYAGWPFFKIQAQQQWLKDHPNEIPPPAAQPAGTFILHRFNGDEVYRFDSAVMYAYVSEKGATLWFEVKADRKGATRCEDTVELGMAPKAEVGINLAKLDADKLVGRTFSIPGTKTDAEDSCMSLLYYCEHEPLRKNKIAILSRAGDRFRVRWTAVTKDVNYYDGSKPPTNVEIEGEFRFKDLANWVRI